MTEIVAVAAGSYHTVGLRADGTVVAAGANDSKQCDFSGWKLFNSVDTIEQERKEAAERAEQERASCGQQDDDQQHQPVVEDLPVAADVEPLREFLLKHAEEQAERQKNAGDLHFHEAADDPGEQNDAEDQVDDRDLADDAEVDAGRVKDDQNGRGEEDDPPENAFPSPGSFSVPRRDDFCSHIDYLLISSILSMKDL